ncbi:hypothetical protein AOA59_09905 [Pseudomonas sp. 2822-15]|nr:hypothetical protein AOA59_09905 [Pseudomonas sp. 2822-15]
MNTTTQIYARHEVQTRGSRAQPEAAACKRSKQERARTAAQRTLDAIEGRNLAEGMGKLLFPAPERPGRPLGRGVRPKGAQVLRSEAMSQSSGTLAHH